MLWVKHVYGEEADEAWAKLSERVVTVSPGWSESYGLLTSGEVPMVLSYTTSPAYHIIAEESERYQAAAFEEGHYMQIEVAGITTRGANNPLARQFSGIHDRSRLPGCHPRDQLDVPGRRHVRAAEPGLRPHGRAIATASLQPGGGGGKPPGMGR